MTAAEFSAAIIGADNDITAAITQRLQKAGAAVENPEAESPDALFGVHLVTDDKDAVAATEEATWPLLAALKSRRASGRMPRYAVLVIAGEAPQLVALAQAQFNYITADSLNDDLHLNIIYADYYAPAMTPESREHIRERFGADSLVEAGQIADAAVTLVSGLMDGIKAQVIPLRKGMPALHDTGRNGEH